VTSLTVGLGLAALDQLRAMPEAPDPWLVFSDVAPSVAATALAGALAGLIVWLALLLVGRLPWFRRLTLPVPQGAWARVVGIAVVVLFLAVVGTGAFALTRQSRMIVQPSGAEVTSGHEVPSIVMITIDTLRADAVSWYNPNTPATPGIDSLAGDATVFLGAYSASSWTVPSVISLMTGVPAMVHLVGSGGGPLPAEIPTLAERLRNAAYYTAAIVDNPLLDPELGFFRGFEEYAPMTEYWPEVESFGRRLLRRWLPGGFREPGTPAVTAEVRSWLEQNRDRDFFLWIHFYDPHVPYAPPARLMPPGTVPEKIGVQFNQQNEVRQGMKLTSRERDWVRELYLSETRYVDEQVGAVLATLKALNLYDEALIALTSDHGEEFWEHGGYEHGHTAYEEVVRVPLIVKLPGSTSITTVDSPVSNHHLMPTILEQAGVRAGDQCSSPASLSQLWGNEPVADFGPISLMSNLFHEERLAVRFDGMKFIRSLVSGRDELYDLVADPGETRSLIGFDEERAERGRQALSEMEAVQHAIRECYGAEEGEAPAPDPAVLERLKSLGYIQ